MSAATPVYALWHGGASYALPCVPDDVEEFPSITAAVEEFERRAWNSTRFYPCVSTEEPEAGGPEMWLLFARPCEFSDPYPDRIVSFGPRGGVRVEVA